MFNDVHKSFLQTCSNYGCLTEKNALKILEQTMAKFDEERPCNKEILNEIIEEINERISFVDQKIIETDHHLMNNDNFIVFINTAEDSINKNQVNYSLSDRNYFALLLKELVLSEYRCLGVIAAINIVSDLKDKKLNKTHARELLDHWISLGYFLNQDEKIFFGPKCLAEYGVYLKNHYPNDVLECPICKSGIFYGLKCGQDECNHLFHRSCVKERLKKLSDCPSCKGLWKSRT